MRVTIALPFVALLFVPLLAIAAPDQNRDPAKLYTEHCAGSMRLDANTGKLL